MKSLHDGPVRSEMRERLRGLSTESRARWGRMTVSQMLAHLLAWMDMALGSLPIGQRRLFVRFPIIKQLVVYFVPFPKGLPTAPELTMRVPASAFDADVTALEAALDRFGAHDPGAPWPPHPAFGSLSRRAWGVLAYRHMDHHLRQFGV